MKIDIINTDFDKLPFRESDKKYAWKKYWRSWREYRFKGQNIYQIAQRIIDNNIGKSFDKAFSYYCSKVPQRYQYVFKKNFEDRGRYEEYFIDEFGNIQISPNSWIFRKSKNSTSIKSDDYTTELRHKITGHKESDFDEVYLIIRKEITLASGTIRKYKDRIKTGNLKHKTGYITTIKDFEPICIKGWIKYFESKNDPQYIKLYQERRKAKRKAKRLKVDKDFDLILKDGTTRIDVFKRKQREEMKRQEELNTQTIVRHGFDPITSFRTHRV